MRNKEYYIVHFIIGCVIFGVAFFMGWFLSPKTQIVAPPSEDLKYNNLAKELCLSKGKVPNIDGWGKVVGCVE